MDTHADVLPARPKPEKTATARLSLELAFCVGRRLHLGKDVAAVGHLLHQPRVARGGRWGPGYEGVAVLRAGAGAGGRAVVCAAGAKAMTGAVRRG
jgi:hypothetical protein